MCHARAQAALDCGDAAAAGALVEQLCAENAQTLPHVHALLGQVGLGRGDTTGARSVLASTVEVARATDGTPAGCAAAAPLDTASAAAPALALDDRCVYWLSR